MNISYIPKNVKYKLNINWERIVLITVISVFLLVNMLVILISYNFYYDNFQNPKSKGKNQYYDFYYTFSNFKYATLQKEDVTIYSNYGYKLLGTYFSNPTPTKNTIILVNGENGSRWSMMEYVEMYINKNFNVLIYDSRACGESGGKDVSFGYFEKDDLDKWVDWAVYTTKKISTVIPSNVIIGIHGEGTGATAAILQTELNAVSYRVNFYIADSSYTNLTDYLKLKLEKELPIKNKYITDYFMVYINLMINKFSGFKASDVSPSKVVQDISTPILFINDSKDSIVPVTMAKELMKNKKDKKDLYITNNKGTEEFFVSHKDEYIQRVYKFIDTILVQASKG
ncbi:MAG TPA: alpha/beta hydrolase [Clostridiaceae bacterium]